MLNNNFIFLIFLFFIAIDCFSETAPIIGFATKVSGNVLLITPPSTKGVSIKDGAKIFELSSIQTTKGSGAKVILKNGTIINISENTLFEFSEISKSNEGGSSSGTSFKLLYGKVRSIVTTKDGEEVKVNTPVAIMGIRGTDFYSTFERNFKEKTSQTSLYTLSGKVAFYTKDSSAETGVLVSAGQFSSITSTSTGDIEKPKAPEAISKDTITELEKNMIPLLSQEKEVSLATNSFLANLNKNIKDETQEVIDPTSSGNKLDISLDDNTQLKQEVTTVAVTPQLPITSNIITSSSDTTASSKPQQSDLTVKPIVPESSPKASQQIALADTKQVSKTAEEIPAPAQQNRETLYNKRFELDTWLNDPRYMIVLDIFEKQENKSLVRFLRHGSVSEESKKRTKVSTIDAIFYDKQSTTKWKVPSKNVKKLTTKAYSPKKDFIGTEIEFLATPGTYTVSIDNGPATDITIPEMKDVTFKTSAIISPGSSYAIYNSILGIFQPCRNKGNPIFALPGKYKLSREVKDESNITTGEKAEQLITVEPNALFTPKAE